MIFATVNTILGLSQEQLPKPAELASGEVIRIYQRSFGRKLFENILVLTPTKAFNVDGEIRHWMRLSRDQQVQLKSILSTEPKGFRDKKRDHPMWPSAYDASDIWMSYRVGSETRLWTNRDYEYPTADCPLAKFLYDLKTKLAQLPNE